MARSSYIYLVTLSGVPRAAFTVKHELVGWLNRAEPADYELWRCRDGSFQDKAPERMDDPRADQTVPGTAKIPHSSK